MRVVSITLNSITISPYNYSYIVELFSTSSNYLHETEREGRIVMDPIDTIFISTESLAVKFLSWYSKLQVYWQFSGGKIK